MNKRNKVAPPTAAEMRAFTLDYKGKVYTIPVSVGFLIQAQKLLGKDILKEITAGRFDLETAIGFVTAALRSLGGEYRDLTVEECAMSIPIKQAGPLLAEFAAAIAPNLAPNPSAEGNAEAEKPGPGSESIE